MMEQWQCSWSARLREPNIIRGRAEPVENRFEDKPEGLRWQRRSRSRLGRLQGQRAWGGGERKGLGGERAAFHDGKRDQWED